MTSSKPKMWISPENSLRMARRFRCVANKPVYTSPVAISQHFYSFLFFFYICFLRKLNRLDGVFNAGPIDCSPYGAVCRRPMDHSQRSVRLPVLANRLDNSIRHAVGVSPTSFRPVHSGLHTYTTVYVCNPPRETPSAQRRHRQSAGGATARVLIREVSIQAESSFPSTLLRYSIRFHRHTHTHTHRRARARITLASPLGHFSHAVANAIAYTRWNISGPDPPGSRRDNHKWREGDSSPSLAVGSPPEVQYRSLVVPEIPADNTYFDRYTA